jgi:hypothetical protein
MNDFSEKGSKRKDVSQNNKVEDISKKNQSQNVGIVFYIAFASLVILCLMFSITSKSGDSFFALYFSILAFIYFGSIPCLISIGILSILLYINRLLWNNSTEESGSRHHNSIEDRFEIAPLLAVVGVSLVIILISILFNI